MLPKNEQIRSSTSGPRHLNPMDIYKLHAIYVLILADKAANNVIIVCKKYYIDNVNSDNPTYIPMDDSFETIVKSSQPVHHISGIANV